MKLIMTKGLPASGKTTWAKELLKKEPGKWKRVNKDDLRAMLDNGQWSKANEKFIVSSRDTLIHIALNDGYSVIVDDTNLYPSHELDLKKLAEDHAVAFEIKNFSDVSLSECLRRDKVRANSVGDKVIMRMYNQYLKPKIQPALRDEKLRDAIICDLDGTLALFGDANPYDRDFTKDKVNEVVRRILLSSGKPNIDVIFVSGRKDKFKEQTEQWLQKVWGPNYILFMRKTAPEGEQEPKDVIVKKEIYDNQIKGKYNILFVLDDRNQVVDMWRSQGLTVLQVAEGNF